VSFLANGASVHKKEEEEAGCWNNEGSSEYVIYLRMCNCKNFISPQNTLPHYWRKSVELKSMLGHTFLMWYNIVYRVYYILQGTLKKIKEWCKRPSFAIAKTVTLESGMGLDRLNVALHLRKLLITLYNLLSLFCTR